MKLYTTQTGEGFYGGACGDDYTEVKIYKVRLRVLAMKRGGGFIDTPVEDREKVIIGNRDRALSIYHDYRNNYRTWMETSSKYRGFVEVFEAFVHTDGEVSNYPEGSAYIDRESTES